ncbi:zinc finger CCCH-type with G patch domain-containing protein isoform X2 [Orussus abietinus]|uniref:zinc finger CCCH-type with G patch domain-containing protein isoform X2 n=1 Tax=Orussus abietinus TaxID=222816 RepID=UPI0006256444|nr:zinc finger CCCH-type with G patch domain-containing protein isoform X2 [Orussus abietinus]
MSDTDSLENAIKQYEEQLSQVCLALSATSEGSDRDDLFRLQSDLQELISLTKENLQTENKANTDTSVLVCNTQQTNNSLDEEYALFEAELAERPPDSQNESGAENSNTIEEDLKALEGMKCRAPHGSSWGGTGYHNAMVCSVLNSDDDTISSMNDIKVKVLFINPTHKEMLPCPYFLDGMCKFSDSQCHFSHGEIVPLSTLQEYREPDFSSIKMGSRVLGQQKTKLWHRCIVLKTPENENDLYRVKFESSGNIIELSLQDLLPLNDAELEMSDSSEDSDVEINDERVTTESIDDQVHKSLLTLNSTEPLGKWEQYTRGMGSKLMAQMGYISGTGLGRRADGRIIPVEATVLPAGKSLDHCMELRENAGGDEDLFSVQRRMQKEQRKLEQKQEKLYQKEKQREKNNVFNIINAALGEDKNKPSSSKNRTDFKTESNRKLNVASFQISENIARLEKESLKLKDSLGRHAKGSLHYNNIVLQYNEKQRQLTDLRTCERHITAEQNQRKNKTKLTVF